MKAAGKLVDQVLAQSVFADIARTDKSASTRLQAATRLADNVLAQRVYADLAMAASWVRYDRTEGEDYFFEDFGQDVLPHLTDQKLLAEVALEARDLNLRWQAAYRITDPAVAQRAFAAVATSYKLRSSGYEERDTSQACVAAAEKLNDEALAGSVFADIAKATGVPGWLRDRAAANLRVIRSRQQESPGESSTPRPVVGPSA